MLIGKFRGVDIRTMGSGYAGGTNAFRTQGPLFAVSVTRKLLSFHFLNQHLTTLKTITITSFAARAITEQLIFVLAEKGLTQKKKELILSWMF